LKEDELNVLYRGALAFVHLSEKEGFNIPILEASNCGAAMILSDIPVHREVAEKAAIFVKDRNEAVAAMKKMMDPEIQKDYSQMSKRLARKYDWEKYAKMAEQFFRALVRS